MQFPEPLQTPDGTGVVSQFLDAFLRGNRDDQVRRGDGSISQAWDLMNDKTMVMNRVLSKAANSLIQQALKLPDDQLVNTLFMTVLSRHPSSDGDEHRSHQSEDQPDDGGSEPALEPLQQSGFRL